MYLLCGWRGRSHCAVQAGLELPMWNKMPLDSGPPLPASRVMECMPPCLPFLVSVYLKKKNRATFIEKSPRLPHIERVFNYALVLFQQCTSVKVINQDCKLCPGYIVITYFVEWVRFFSLHFNPLFSHSFHTEEITKPLLG